MNDIDTLQQFRDHIKGGRRDANTDDLIQKARELLRPMANPEMAAELGDLIREMVNLPPEQLKTWLGSSVVKM